MKTLCMGTLVLSCTLFHLANAQYWVPSGGRSSAMGNTSVALFDSWSVSNNQAGMAFTKQPSAGLCFENRYLLKELCYQAVSLTYPIQSGVLGGSFNYSGDPLFNALKTGLSYASKIGDRFSAGIQLDILRTHLAKGYGTRTSATFESGIQLMLSDKLRFGAHLFNPMCVRLGEFNDERIPIIMNAGLSYTYSNQFLAAAEVLKSSQYPMEFLMGMEYKFFGNGFVRAGFECSPVRYSFGAGFIIKQLSIDISSTYHEILGFSPKVSIQYFFIN